MKKEIYGGAPAPLVDEKGISGRWSVLLRPSYDHTIDMLNLCLSTY